MMKYPCEVQDALIGGKSTVYENIGCAAEDWMKSPQSMILGPIVLVSRGMLAMVFKWMGSAGGPCKTLPMFFFKMEQLLSLRLWQLKYHKDPTVFGWSAGFYFVLLAEMLVVSVFLRSGVGLLVGLGAGEIYIQMANQVLKPSPEVLALIDGKLSTWTEQDKSRRLLLELGEVSLPAWTLNQAQIDVFQNELASGSLRLLLDDVTKAQLHLYSQPWNSWWSVPCYWEAQTLKTIYVPEQDKFISACGEDESIDSQDPTCHRLCGGP
jgi:hypothetical protein